MFLLKHYDPSVAHHHATKSVRHVQTSHIVQYEIFILALQQMSPAAAAPLLQVHFSAPEKFLSLSTKSVKAADVVILQTSNNIPWHLHSELSVLSGFTLHVCSLEQVILRCHPTSTHGQL